MQIIATCDVSNKKILETSEQVNIASSIMILFANIRQTRYYSVLHDD